MEDVVKSPVGRKLRSSSMKDLSVVPPESTAKTLLKDPQVNPFSKSLCNSNRHYPTKLSKASSKSSRQSVDRLARQLEQQVLEEELAVCERELEVSRRRLEVKRLALATIKSETEVLIPLEDEAGSCDMDIHDKVGRYLSTCNAAEPVTTKPCGESMNSVIATMALPKIEIEKFDGHPRRFCKFMKSFQVNVADRVTDNTQRLMYLIHYCSGEAKELIEDCVLLPECTGYDRAIELLRKQFGRPHDIVESFLDGILSGDGVAADDINGLRKLVRDLTSCEIALSQMQYTADLNCSTNLKRIVMRLPRHLQREWAKVADELICRREDPSFRHLIEFLERSVSVATNVYGRLLSASCSVGDRNSVGGRNFRIPRSAINVVASNDTRCPVCASEHLIATCAQFIGKNTKDKISTLRQHKMCFNCLKPNHRANECRSLLRCDISGCGKRHHRLLHYEIPAASNGNSVVNINSQASRNLPAFLGFIPVRLAGPGGHLTCYALLDSGSDTTLLSKKAAVQLGLRGTTEELEISSFHGVSRKRMTKVSCSIESYDRSYRAPIETAYVVESLPVDKAYLPTDDTLSEYPHFEDVRLTRIPDKSVLILIGTNVPDVHWVLQQRFGTSHQPFASLTMFGWVVFGPSGFNNAQKRHLNCLSSQEALATFALRQTSLDNELKYDKQIATVIEKNFYVDDCLVSVDTITEAVEIANRLTNLLRFGGFRLHKWMSSSPEVLANIPGSEISVSPVSLNAQHSALHKTLGLFWNMKDDGFEFGLALPSRPITILSCAASLYDPLGYVAPLLLPPKQLLQKLCRANCGWDAIAGGEIQRIWETWKQNVQQVEKLQIPRCIKPKGFIIEHASLHLFSDASEVGYGAVAYLRCTRARQVHVSFIMGKSRVAPLKPVTIPRLELQAAVLSVRLMLFIRKELDIELNEVYFWTDSTIVLHYIFSTRSRFKTFLSNRIGFIHENTQTAQWKHVPTNVNPADCASRGITSNVLQELNDWLRGPKYLKMEEESWPKLNLPAITVSPSDAEIKKEVTVFTMTQSSTPTDRLLTYYSSWKKLIRAVVWYEKFKQYIRDIKLPHRKAPVTCAILQPDELSLAEESIIRYVQRTDLPESRLFQTGSSTEKREICKTSHLYKLNPVMRSGLLCVGGRLRNSDLDDTSKYPVIIPKDHPVTRSIIRYIHETEGHMGWSYVLASLRSKYWVLKGTAAVKNVVNRCVSCRMRSARPMQQLMADLPTARVQAQYPFASVGVDYFGPFEARVGRSHRKQYGCLFTCLKTRAVHIEVAYSLSIDSFLMALSRFINRRGRPRELFSDRGSNFVGADYELRSLVRSLDCDAVNGSMSEWRIVWHFNPPYSSHRGGVWERMIRSVRRILSAVSREQTLTEESLLTYLTEVERILNNRPLIPVRDDPAEPDALTPNHILLPRGSSIPATDNSDLRLRYTRQWRQSQLMADTFWRRWLKEYIPLLQLRQKWLQPKRNIKVGDLVIVSNDSAPRGTWIKGLVTGAIPQSDGLVRTVEVKTASGTITRDLRKVCLLEGVDER